VSCLRENLTSSSYGEGLETGRPIQAPRQSFTRQLYFKTLKSSCKIKTFVGNYLFVASERSGKAAATLYSLIQSATANGLNPYAYLRDVFTRLPSTKAKDIDSLLPHIWKPAI